MNRGKIHIITRILIAFCGLALIVVLKVPMWRIELTAPQYPEGLKLLIFANRLGGNVDIINGLNHYIGMKTLHTKDFMEFILLPGIIIFFIVACMITALLGKRKWLYILLILFVSFGVIAMIDFWRWEYNYGHHLNPEAAIIVPGMAYQPPLIGFKQLLNFGAYSIPDLGGWIFVGVGATLLMLVIFEWWTYWKLKRVSVRVRTAMAMISLVLLNSCTGGRPEAIKIGEDDCSYCKMTISDNRYGAEIMTDKGKAYKFDDSHCLLSFMHSGTIEKKDLASVYFTDFTGAHSLVKEDKAFLLKSDHFNGPMNGHIAAFSNQDSMNRMAHEFKGVIVTWKQLNQ
jgi:copper chaperone NosL